LAGKTEFVINFGANIYSQTSPCLASLIVVTIAFFAIKGRGVVRLMIVGAGKTVDGDFVGPVGGLQSGRGENA